MLEPDHSRPEMSLKKDDLSTCVCVLCFLVVGIPRRETPPQRLQTVSVGWNLICVARRMFAPIPISCII
jgi:hypothetical protein